MKKAAALTAVILTALFFVFGCADNAPTDPADPTPLPTPVILDENLMLSDFEDQTLCFTAGAVTGCWSALNDSKSGGTSSVTDFGPSATPSAGHGSYAFKTNAVVNTSLPIGTGDDITAMGIGYTNAGYIINSLVFTGPVSLTRNTGISWDNMATGSTDINHRVYIFDTSLRYIYTGYADSAATWGSSMHAFEVFFLPDGAEYTKEDVLKSVHKIFWVHRVYSTINTSVTAEFFIDTIKLESL